MMQDNENDELEMGTTEITQLLGDKENLYQKILYLVIADSAYSEGNLWYLVIETTKSRFTEKHTFYGVNKTSKKNPFEV